jgi:hypothetical protein
MCNFTLHDIYALYRVSDCCTMGCACGKKKKTDVLSPDMQNAKNIIQTITYSQVDLITPADWGPLFWRVLHILAERVGGTAVPAGILMQHAWGIEFLITNLQYMLPCKECQQHFKEHLVDTPIVNWKSLSGADLRKTARTWLWNLHNAVRASQGKPVMIATADDCIPLYGGKTIEKWEIEVLYAYGKFGVRAGYTTMDAWNRWTTQLTRLRGILGML